MEPATVLGFSFVTGFSVVVYLVILSIKKKEIKNLKELRDADIRRYESLKTDISITRFMVSGVLNEAVENGEANPTVWYHVMKRLHTVPELRRDLSLDEKYERMLEEYCSDKERENNAK